LNPAEVLKQVFKMSWLWSIFAGFYLVAYAFWVPRLFDSLPLVIAVAAATLVLGAGFLYDGFLKAIELQSGIKHRPLAYRRVRQLVGGFLLLGYLLVYLPPQGRIVAHWPLDLAITAVSGLVMLIYGIWNIQA
jgi:hypothetical protein